MQLKFLTITIKWNSGDPTPNGNEQSECMIQTKFAEMLGDGNEKQMFPRSPFHGTVYLSLLCIYR